MALSGSIKISPIEAQFQKAWEDRWDTPLLVPQYEIGRYRVDFAHPETKSVIELDGFQHHSSPDDIAKDRKRQRAIEKLGWRVTRFGGKEIHEHVDVCVEEMLEILLKRLEKP